MKKHQKLSLLSFSFVSFLLTSCQVVFEEVINIKEAEIELANYHIKNNQIQTDRGYALTYKNKNYDEDLLTPHAGIANDGTNGLGYLSWSPSLQSTNGTLNQDKNYFYLDNSHPQLADTPGRNYKWFKAEMTDMEGLSIDNVFGWVILGTGSEKIDTSRNNVFTTHFYVYPSEDEINEIYRYKTIRLYGIEQAENEYNKPILDKKYYYPEKSSFPYTIDGENYISNLDEHKAQLEEIEQWENDDGYLDYEENQVVVDLKSYFAKWLDKIEKFLTKYKDTDETLSSLGYRNSSGCSFTFRDESFYYKDYYNRSTPPKEQDYDKSAKYNEINSTLLGHNFNADETKGNGGGEIVEVEKTSMWETIPGIFTGNIKTSAEDDRKNINKKLDTLSDAFNDQLMATINANGCMTTEELRSKLYSIESTFYNYYETILMRGYDEALNYWQNEINKANSTINSKISEIATRKSYLNRAWCRLGGFYENQPFTENRYQSSYIKNYSDKDGYYYNYTLEEIYSIDEEKAIYENNVKVLKQQQENWTKLADDYENNNEEYNTALKNWQSAKNSYEENENDISTAESAKERLENDRRQKIDDAWDNYQSKLSSYDEEIKEAQDDIDYYDEQSDIAYEEHDLEALDYYQKLYLEAKERYAELVANRSEMSSVYQEEYYEDVEIINDTYNPQIEEYEEILGKLYDKRAILETKVSESYTIYKPLKDKLDWYRSMAKSRGTEAQQMQNQYDACVNEYNKYTSWTSKIIEMYGVYINYNKLEKLNKELGQYVDGSWGTHKASGIEFYWGGRTFKYTNSDVEFEGTDYERLEKCKYWYNIWYDRKYKFKTWFNFSRVFDDFEDTWNGYINNFKVDLIENEGVNYYRKNYLTNDILIPLKGIYEPCVYEFGSESFTLNTYTFPNINNEGVNKSVELSKYFSYYYQNRTDSKDENGIWHTELQGMYGNSIVSNDSQLYLFAFNIWNNYPSDDKNKFYYQKVDGTSKQYNLNLLNNGLTNFTNQFDKFNIVIKFDYSQIYDTNGNPVDANSLYLTMGNVHFVPNYDSYEKELNAGKYEEWEIRNMNAAKEANDRKNDGGDD